MQITALKWFTSTDYREYLFREYWSAAILVRLGVLDQYSGFSSSGERLEGHNTLDDVTVATSTLFEPEIRYRKMCKWDIDLERIFNYFAKFDLI